MPVSTASSSCFSLWPSSLSSSSSSSFYAVPHMPFASSFSSSSSSPPDVRDLPGEQLVLEALDFQKSLFSHSLSSFESPVEASRSPGDGGPQPHAAHSGSAYDSFGSVCGWEMAQQLRTRLPPAPETYPPPSVLPSEPPLILPTLSPLPQCTIQSTSSVPRQTLSWLADPYSPQRKRGVDQALVNAAPRDQDEDQQETTVKGRFHVSSLRRRKAKQQQETFVGWSREDTWLSSFNCSREVMMVFEKYAVPLCAFLSPHN